MFKPENTFYMWAFAYYVGSVFGYLRAASAHDDIMAAIERYKAKRMAAK